MRVINTSTPTAWPPHVPPPTLSERRSMKKAAQPEHAYTGHIPTWRQDPNEAAQADVTQATRHAPILGYSGHLRRDVDCVGTTFSKGLEIARQPLAAPAVDSLSRLKVQGNNQRQGEPARARVTFQDRGDHQKTKVSHVRAADPCGNHLAKPMSARSGYGAFDGASGYGMFAAPPAKSTDSGYGDFDDASGYGEFQAKPMSARSGYGAFDGASGYGQFAAPPKQGNMSARSGYGAFDGASGYGQFAAPPKQGNMSARSGYGAFDGASGYGEFMAKPASGSGYGAFDGASGYGAFLDRPELEGGDENPGAGEYTAVMKHSDELGRQYQRALRTVGGEPHVHSLLDAFATTIAQRHHKRTELLQTIKRHFEKHEQQNQGRMSKAHLKEALQGLACVFTDDQIVALMAVYDPDCSGYVSMDAVLTDLTHRAMAS